MTSMSEEKTAGYQRWRNLLFMHWPVPAEALRSLVPTSLELDSHNGVHYIGLVPFEMVDIRLSWMPRGTGLNFLETNVRTYVRHNGKPGVYFLSLEASSKLAVRVARIQWGLPYYDAAMSFGRQGDAVEYESNRKNEKQPTGVKVKYRIGSPLEDSAPGTLQHFLLERYHLFLERRGQLWSGKVEHKPYPAESATLTYFEETLISASGVGRLGVPPPLVHYASGVDVRMCALRKV